MIGGRGTDNPLDGLCHDLSLCAFPTTNGDQMIVLKALVGLIAFVWVASVVWVIVGIITENGDN